MLAATWKKPAGADYAGEVQRTVDYCMLERLMTLAADRQTTPQVRAVSTVELAALRDWLSTAAANAGAPAQHAHLAHGARLITEYLDHPKDFVPLKDDPAPPGGPIGDDF